MMTQCTFRLDCFLLLRGHLENLQFSIFCIWRRRFCRERLIFFWSHGHNNRFRSYFLWGFKMTFYQVKKYSTVSNIQWMTAQVQSTITILSNRRLSKSTVMDNSCPWLYDKWVLLINLFNIKKYILENF